MFSNLVDNILLWNNKTLKRNINILNFTLNYKVTTLNDKKVIKSKKKNRIINKNLLTLLVLLQVIFSFMLLA